MATIWAFALDENLEGLEELVSAGGVSVDATDDLGQTALHLAASRGLEDVVKVLLQNGADVNVKDRESSWTPLHRSLYFGHIRVSLLLVQAGALLEGGRDSPASKIHRPRGRLRSESFGSASKSKASKVSKRRDGLGDGDGNSPLDVLSLELRPQLKRAREAGLGGDVYSFGKADFILGYECFGKADDIVQPKRIEALANLQVVRVAASKYHSAAVTLCGKLFTWGHGRSGRLGHGNEDVCMLPTLVEALRNQVVTAVAASETHTAAVTKDGELYTWGRDRFGQLGHGPGSSGRLVPKRVEGLRKVSVVGVATGTDHTAVVTRSGGCYTWGRNNHGQLGGASASQQHSPRVVSYLASGASRGSGGVGRHVIKVSASARSTVVVTRGVDKGSGLRPVNEVHQWGHGSEIPSRVNFSVNDGGSSSRWRTHDARVNITEVAAAKCHNLALSSVGQVFTWGFGADNLGLDPRETRTARGPQLVAAMLPENCGGNAVYISASEQHSCVVTDTGDLYTWGTAGEGGGGLGHGNNRWQPLAKRVSSLKKVAAVAAGPDHTVVLLQASCPYLPHGASTVSSCSQHGSGRLDRALVHDRDGPEQEGGNGQGGQEKEDLDSDSDYSENVDENLGENLGGNGQANCNGASGLASCSGGLVAVASDGGSEPLTLKQHCEVVLAREVDLTNASSILAYADALDAPALVKYCAEFVSTNLDGILVMGRESDRCCLLETSGDLACSLLHTSGFSRALRLFSPNAVKPALSEDTAALDVHEDDEGLDREAMATALARAEMRAKTPSTKIAARAVRSLKKKIARIVELEGLRDRGKDLSADQVCKLAKKPRMEAELCSLDSQLERAKLAQASRTRRLQTVDKACELEEEAFPSKESPSAARALFCDEDTFTADPEGSRPSKAISKGDLQWTPQLDFSRYEVKTNESPPLKCEACRVQCADGNMYADHLKGKRHRATMARLEAQLHDAAKASPPQTTPRTWANISVENSGGGRDAGAAGLTNCPCAAAMTVPAGAHVRDAVRGVRESRPETVAEKPSQPRSVPNQLPRSNDLGRMRHALEKQQRAATALVSGDASNQEATASGRHALSSLRSSASGAGSSSSHESAYQHSPPEDAAAAPAAYSLVDFIAAPASKKSSRRNKRSSDRQEKSGRVWGEREPSVLANTDAAEVMSSNSAATNSGVGEPMRTRKSFHEIIEEEEREKKERDEYGDSVWFVSRKPRSTSFEGIVQQQRREERVAEEERRSTLEHEMEEEMLRMVLEMSKHDAQPGQQGCQPRSGQGKEGAGRRAKNRKENVRDVHKSKDKTASSKTARKHAPAGSASLSGPRNNGSDEGGSSRAPSNGARARRTRRQNHGPRCSTASDATNAQGRESCKQKASAPQAGR